MHEKMIKVYIASPYTSGYMAENVKTQIDAYSALMDIGFAPYAPVLTHFVEIAKPRPYWMWMKICLEYVTACDCVLRLGGDSPGATMEVDLATELGKRVFYSIEELNKFWNE